MEFSAPFCPIPEVPESYATLYVTLHMWYMYYTCISFLPLVEAFDCADAVNKRERTNENNSSNCSESIEKMDKYSSMVQKLLSLSIKLVAVDFDKTIINIHTRGSWQFTSKSLVSRVRPSFKQFFTAVLNTSGLHVAVVTHSSQIPLIREVLEQALPDCDTSRIHYRGKGGEWKEVKGVTKEGTVLHFFVR